jgi:transport family protein 27
MSATNAAVVPLRLRCKVLILGESTVGKTSICQTFCSNGTEFPKNYLMTICCDLQVKVVQIPDSSVSVELFIYDCSGQDIFREQVAQVLDGTCAVVYVYHPAPPANETQLTNLRQLLPLFLPLSLAQCSFAGTM